MPDCRMMAPLVTVKLPALLNTAPLLSARKMAPEAPNVALDPAALVKEPPTINTSLPPWKSTPPLATNVTLLSAPPVRTSRLLEVNVPLPVIVPPVTVVLLGSV